MNLEFYESGDAVVGVLSVRLVIRNASSLKDKRHIIKSLKDHVKNKFNVSISGTGALDHCQYSRLSVAMVGNDLHYVNSTLSNLINMLRVATSFELADYQLKFV